MVRIIKEGQLPEKQICRKKCQECGTEYEFERGEAKIGSDYRGSWITINCPFCGKLNYFNKY